VQGEVLKNSSTQRQKERNSVVDDAKLNKNTQQTKELQENLSTQTQQLKRKRPREGWLGGGIIMRGVLVGNAQAKDKGGRTYTRSFRYPSMEKKQGRKKLREKFFQPMHGEIQNKKENTEAKYRQGRQNKKLGKTCRKIKTFK